MEIEIKEVVSNLAIWIPVVTAILSATLASLGTYFVTKRTINAAADQAKKQREFDAEERRKDREHSAHLAVTERRQRRYELAYGPVRRYIQEANVFALDVIRNSYNQEPIATPRPQFSSETFAIVGLNASEQALNLFDQVQRALAVLEIDAEHVGFLKGLDNPMPMERREEYMEAVNARRETEKALFASFEALNEHMRHELNEPGSQGENR